MESVGVRSALLAQISYHIGRAHALSSGRLAHGATRTLARLAVGESVVPTLAGSARALDHIRFALALTSKRMTLEARGSSVVAIARQCSTVVIGGQGENGLLAEVTGIVGDVEVVVAAVLDELLGLVEGLLHQQVIVILLQRDHHQVVQPNALGSIGLKKC